MNYKSLLIRLFLVFGPVTSFGQNCGVDTTTLKLKRFLPDFPTNDPWEGYSYRFDTLADGTWKQYRLAPLHVYKIWTVSNGRLQGSVIYFNEWGERISMECYKDGILTSILNYHTNGIASESWVFNPDKDVISRKTWYPNGVLKIDAGKDIQLRWHENGLLWMRKKFENNSLIRVQVFDKEGEMYHQGFWNGGQPITDRQFIYKNGSMKRVSYRSIKEDSRKIIEANDLMR